MLYKRSIKMTRCDWCAKEFDGTQCCYDDESGRLHFCSVRCRASFESHYEQEQRDKQARRESAARERERLEAEQERAYAERQRLEEEREYRYEHEQRAEQARRESAAREKKRLEAEQERLRVEQQRLEEEQSARAEKLKREQENYEYQRLIGDIERDLSAYNVADIMGAENIYDKILEMVEFFCKKNQNYTVLQVNMEYLRSALYKFGSDT